MRKTIMICLAFASFGTTAVFAAPSAAPDATYQFYSLTNHLAWEHLGGDTAGPALDTTTVNVGDAAVTLRTGKDGYVLIRPEGVPVTFGASANTADVLRPTCSAGPLAFNTVLNATTISPLNALPTLNTGNGSAILLKCAAAGTVTLHPVKVWGRSATLTAYQPDPHEVIPAMPTYPVDGTIVSEITGKTMRPSANLVLNPDGTATCEISDKQITCMADIRKLPPAPEYWATVVLKLGDDWPNSGGKLPGFANTGQLDAYSKRADCHAQGGWGGRPATGCRWSARTGWWGRVDGMIGRGTYDYTLNQHNARYSHGRKDSNGYTEYLPTPIPVGKWTAYVQHVRVNTVGGEDGIQEITLIDACGAIVPQYVNTTMHYRDVGGPESEINTFWTDVYCGGRACSGWSNAAHTAHATLKRVTITVGQPDMTKLAAKVRALNSHQPAVCKATQSK